MKCVTEYDVLPWYLRLLGVTSDTEVDVQTQHCYRIEGVPGRSQLQVEPVRLLTTRRWLGMLQISRDVHYENLGMLHDMGRDVYLYEDGTSVYHSRLVFQERLPLWKIDAIHRYLDETRAKHRPMKVVHQMTITSFPNKPRLINAAVRSG